MDKRDIRRFGGRSLLEVEEFLYPYMCADASHNKCPLSLPASEISALQPWRWRHRGPMKCW